jgi:hypothetical protein
MFTAKLITYGILNTRKTEIGCPLRWSVVSGLEVFEKNRCPADPILPCLVKRINREAPILLFSPASCYILSLGANRPAYAKQKQL